MMASIFILLFAQGERSEAWGKLIGFVVGFALALIVGLALIAWKKKKRSKKREEAAAMNSGRRETEDSGRKE